MNSLELFFQQLHQYEMAKRDNQRTGSTQVVESPLLDMNFDFADAPPAVVNEQNNNKKENHDKEKKGKPKKSSIRKVNPPRPIKKRPVKEVKEDKVVDKVEPPKLSKRMKRVRKNLRIDMVGYEQRPNYATRSNPNKRRK